MHSLVNTLFWVNALYFIAAVFLAFFIPGHLCIRKLKLDVFSELIVSTITGLTLWSLLGFILGFLHLRNVLYLYLAVCLIIWIKQKQYLRIHHLFHHPIPLGLTVLVLFGTLIQLSSIWFIGIQQDNGLFVCCGVPDTITHLSLTSELVRRFPPNEPGFSDIPLYNYHYLSNLGVADLVRTFRLSLIPTQYQYMTVFLSLLLGLSALAFITALKLGKRTTYWFVFFLYFCGDIIFLLPALMGKGFQFSLTTLENASTLWISPPRFFALVILFCGLTLFVEWIKKKSLFTGILMALVLGSLIGFKVYIGMFILSGFACLALYYLFTKNFRRLFPIVLLFCTSLHLWIPVNRQAGGMFFTGFWRFEDFIVQPALGLTQLELARRTFLFYNNYFRAYLYDLLFLFLYIVFSAGTIMLGVFQTKGSLKKIPIEVHIVLLSGLISTCCAGFFFMQETGGANSSQFLISIYVVGTLYASCALSWWTRNLSPVQLVFTSILVIGLTSTRVFHDTFVRMTNMQNKIGLSVPEKTLDTYRFFAMKKERGTVLVYNDSTPDCLLITIFGARSTFTCTIGMPGVLEEKTLSQRNEVKQTIFTGKDLSLTKQELTKHDISHIFIPKQYVQSTNIPNLNFPIVYETDEIAIYRVLK